MSTVPSQRTLVAYVEDRPGVLNHVASLFRRRTYNIVSLTVGRTHEPGLSRMTIVVEADHDVARRIEANLYKLVNVISVEDITDVPNLVRDVALIKVSAGEDIRVTICRLAEDYRARVVDVATDAITLEVAGRLDTIEGLVEALRPYGILEMVQSGAIAMSRGGEGRVVRQLNLAKDPTCAA
jgi:acetolactate synthase-1/3 small subunit